MSLKIQLTKNKVLQTVSPLYSKNLITKREQDCMKLTICGKSARQVGQELGISQRTVEEYLNNLKKKLGVKSKPELIEKVISILMGRVKKNFKNLI